MRTMTVMTMMVAAALAAGSAGCDTKAKVDRAIDKAGNAAEEMPKLVKQFTSEAMKTIEMNAKQVTQAAVASMAQVAKLPAAATGGVDLGAQLAGKTGAGPVDLKQDGVPEMVTVLVADDMPADSAGGSSQEGTFVMWKGDAAGGADDSGVCYAAWSDASGTAWIVSSDCGDEQHAFVSTVAADGTETVRACASSGACNPCEAASAGACTFPGQ